MHLRKLNYFEHANEPNAWSLEGLILDNINLIVGKNATGKTNSIIRIAWLGNMLAGTMPQLLSSGNYDVEFFDDSDIYKYKLSLSLQKVEYEELVINEEVKLKREKDGKGEIYSAQFKTNMNFQIQPNQLAVTSKRDSIQHPFLEKLAKWAEGLRMYAFSKLGREANPKNINSPINLYTSGEREFGQPFKDSIMESMKEIGYELTALGTTSLGLNSMLYVNEKNSNANILQTQMSQGMVRALSLVIQITYNSFKDLPTTVLIDDIGEGLDFDRSSNVIKLLSRFADKGKCQLIMSTNDRYVMNNISLKHWQFIQRTGGQCKTFNYHNSQEIFEKFAYTGLNNFDFLAMDFINTGANE